MDHHQLSGLTVTGFEQDQEGNDDDDVQIVNVVTIRAPSVGETMTKNAASTARSQSQPKGKRSKETGSSWQKFLYQTFGQSQSSSKLTKAKLKKHFGDNLEFTLSATTQLDDILTLIETYSGHLCHFVKKLTLTIPATDEDVISISDLHLHRLANMPEAFLNQLTKLSFNLRFLESTDFHQITDLLSRCPSLTDFKVQRGVVLKGNEVALHVPKMDKLVSFFYITEINLQGPRYEQPPVPIDVETDASQPDSQMYTSNSSKDNFFRVHFGNLTFPSLEHLCVGPFIELEFGNLSQFPKMKSFEPGRVSGSEPLPWFSTDSTCEDVVSTSLYGVVRIELIKQIPQAFPNLTELRLTFPSVSTLRSVIINVGDMHIKRLAVSVNFEFEAAFFTAFCGHPFKLVTKHDKLKFAKLQKYKHWEGFMKHLGIEVPEEKSSNASLDGKESDPTTIESECTISSWKFLQTFKLSHVEASIYLPKTDLHYNNPDVQLSSTRWSSTKQKFPGPILLEELSKLKGQLRHVNLDDFEVDQDTIDQFEKMMCFKSFKLNFDPSEFSDSGFDTFVRTDTIQDSSSQEIKQEKLEE